jgi:DNA-binding transcriptional LysR family regulator
LELRHLRYFCAVAEALNFSRAAENLRVAQSALSRQIRDLEQELGVQLFVRTTTSVRLTDAGAHFHQSVGKLLMQLSIAITAAQEISNGRGGGFNIASDWRFSIHVIPEMVHRFRQLYPKVKVTFSDLQSAEQIEALRDGRIHLGFVPGPWARVKIWAC